MGLQHPRNKGRVKFYVHVFPTDKLDWDSIKVDVDKKVLYVKHLFDFHSSVSTKPLPKFWCFKTDGIFLNSCQDEVYTQVLSHMWLTEKVFVGGSHTVMSYGQNFSGKSFTLSGFHNQYNLRGIIPRFVIDLFKQLETKLDVYDATVYISVVDVYENFLHDLLSDPRRLCKKSKDVREIKVLSEVECLELLFKAEAQRIIVGNKSYNSHSGTNVVRFTVRLTSINCNEPVDKISKIAFVDLAGIETIFRNPITSFKDRCNQGDANVTKTLLELFALRSQKTNKPEKSMINHNIHLLTRYLGTSFSTASCISLICHIRATHEDIKITMSALKFGRTFQGIPMKKPEENIKTNYDMTLQKLTEEIKYLQDELLIVNLTKEKSSIQISQERIDFVKRTVQSFLNGELSENDLLSLVDDPNLILNLIKTIHNEPIPKSSVTLQTDFIPELIISKQESIKVDQTPRSSMSKKVSIKEVTKGKGGKPKDDGKNKIPDKVVLQSEEVQVNLIEPNAKLPNVESREGLWAMFLISRPDINQVLERLNTGVVEKNKQLNNESIKYDNINQSINNTQLALNHLVAYRHSESQEIYDLEGKVVVPEGEISLVQELRQLQRDLEKSKQRLIDAQFDWLEALERLGKEKEVIEEEFKQFCIANNYFAIMDGNISEEELGVRQYELMAAEESPDTNLKKVYCAFQKKYLHKLCL